MKRVAFNFFVPYPIGFKKRLLQWIQKFPYAALFDSNNYKLDSYSSYDCIAGCAAKAIEIEDDPFHQVDMLSRNGKFLFGYFGYDLKNKIERLTSEKYNYTGFHDSGFFFF